VRMRFACCNKQQRAGRRHVRLRFPLPHCEVCSSCLPPVSPGCSFQLKTLILIADFIAAHLLNCYILPPHTPPPDSAWRS
jgi:hypothetical protein